MKHHRQLFGQDAGKVSSRRKSVLWGQVILAVNSEGVVRRTEDTCRKRFYDIKRRVKAKMAKEAKSARKTGGGPPFRATYRDWEEPVRALIPAEVVSATHVRDSDRPTQDVPQTSRPDRPQTSQDEAGIAGSASGSRPPVRRPSQGLGHLPRRPSKTRRLGSESAAPSSPPRRRLSAVSPQPPLALLASSQSDEPRSPQLSEPSLMADVDQQGQDQQATITLQLTPVDPSQPIQLQDIPQASISPQLAQAPPPSQIPDDFWASWTSQQAQSNASLTAHTQHLASLPHHLPRISRNSGRLIVQVGRMATSMEQIRADNSQMLAHLSRIIDEQQRHQQALVQLIQHNQVVNESLSRIVASHTATNTQLIASLNNLSSNISLMGAHQVTSSSGTTTPIQTPVTSPVRRSSRARASEPAQSSAPSTHKRKK
ncbi:myb-related transcription factor, partner of profilin-like [Pseudophryne corroboree]|uniref:myb-related transcription factor, partner of profilin-like n=4 Tax=Pseudophryne corroboree TaxID=495146 RepID=UPI00308165DD